eukprot:scaffold89351_cov31-Tisochrysis_lutea.AAC.4
MPSPPRGTRRTHTQNHDRPPSRTYVWSSASSTNILPMVGMLSRRSHAFLSRARASAIASAFAALCPSVVSPVAGAVPTMLAPSSTSLAAASSAWRSRSSFSMNFDERKMPSGSTTTPSSERLSGPIVGERERACAQSSREPAATMRRRWRLEDIKQGVRSGRDIQRGWLGNVGARPGNGGVSRYRILTRPLQECLYAFG